MHAYKRYGLFAGLFIVMPILWRLDRFHLTSPPRMTRPIPLSPEEAIRLVATAGYELDLNFEGFPNQTGDPSGKLIVPNIVHYIRLGQPRLTFVEYVCLVSVHVNHRPDYYFVHTDAIKNELAGKYWKWIRLRHPDIWSRIRLVAVETPKEIHGKPLSVKWRLLHGSDVVRARIMMQYGGIYLDNDVFVVNNCDRYRKFELALGWPPNEPMGNQVMIGHRNARFFPLWLDTYRDYRSDDWYYNAGERPTKVVLEKWPHIVHRVERNFGVQNLFYQLYQSENWTDWRQMDTVHLLTNHRHYLDPRFQLYPVFNERNIRHYPFSFGDMVRHILVESQKRTPRRTPPGELSD